MPVGLSGCALDESDVAPGPASQVPRAALERLWARRDVPLGDETLWRLLYETAARAGEALPLNVEDLDLANRRAVIRGMNGELDFLHWQTGTGHLLSRLIAGRTSGPVFLTDRRASPARAPAAVDLCPHTGRARLSYRRAQERFAQATGGWTLHQLRHSALTHLAEANVGLPLLMDDIRYIRRRYLTVEAARSIAVAIADATFAARRQSLWGAGSTAVGSDSTHVRALDQNILTEWHSRYHGRGVLIYWHVERKSMAVHSQLISCSASEVAAMVEGAMRHDTTMDVEANYTDSHGQSEIGFAITRLLGFELLPRIKQINKARLYRPRVGEPDAYPRLAPALTRPIRWGIVAEQYDQMIKYATAIRTGTASTEAILRRFTRNASHPTYAAMLEVGRAQKTIFIARYLRLRDLQREIEQGLNVVESWNGANGVLAYGKRGDIQSNRRDEQELFVLCLRILQAALVYINTLMLQDVLGEPTWTEILTPADRRGLTPLFWMHVLPYGEVNLDMTSRLNLAQPTRLATVDLAAAG